MAAGNFIWFGNALEAIGNGTINFDANSFRLALVTASWTPNQDTDDTWSDLSTYEVANGNGYATHGKALTASWARSGHVVTLSCDDQSWTSSTITAKYAVIVRDADANAALAAGDLLIGYLDLVSGGGSAATTDGTFAVTFNVAGALRITAATS